MSCTNIKAVLTATLLITLLAPFAAEAQSKRLSANLNYNIARPIGNFSDFISNTSFRGWTGNMLYNLNDKFSIGFGTGFQDFYQKYPRDTYKLSDGSDISAVVTNSIQTIPLLALVQYNLAPGKSIQPFIGVGAGGNLVSYRQYLGEFANTNSKLQFAARPEAGFFIPFKKGVEPAGITVTGIYNYMPFNNNGLDNLNSWGVGAGIKLPIK